MTKTEYLAELDRWTVLGRQGIPVNEDSIVNLYESIWRAGYIAAIENALKEVIRAFGHVEGVKLEEVKIEDIRKEMGIDDDL